MVNLTGKIKLLEYLSLLREKIPTFLLVTLMTKGHVVKKGLRLFAGICPMRNKNY